jgi:tetratricopeptide (TPR) repeat protein
METYIGASRSWRIHQADTVALLHQQALIFQADGKLREAEDRGLEALRLKRRESRKDFQLVLLLNTLAAIRLDRRNDRQAQRHAIEAMEILAGLGDPGSDAQADQQRVRALCLIGRSHMHLGEYAEARPLLERAMILVDHCLDPVSPEKSRVLVLLGTLSHRAGHVHEAEECFRSALTVAEKAFDPFHGEVARVCHHLALLAESTEDASPLEAYARRAYEIRFALFGSASPLTAAAQTGLALVLEARGEAHEAGENYVQALGVFDGQYACEQYDYSIQLETLRDYAICRRGAVRHLASCGRLEDARDYSTRAQLVFDRVLGANHPFSSECRREHNEWMKSLRRRMSRNTSALWMLWRSFSFSR